MIIVEGMDGSGKTSLIKRLSEDLGLPVHERSSSSLGGPVPDIFNWTHNDVDTWDQQPLSLYDRHPLITELIYGPIIRGRIDQRFHTDRGLYDAFQKMSLVIFCDTDWENIRNNIMNTAQMTGVLDNARRLHLMYRTYHRVFPGVSQVWDYTTHEYPKIKQTCEQHMKWWESINA